MPFNIPNLLEGKLLTGVLPPEKQPPTQYFLPQYSKPALSDIESCIDDPALAPLGHHIKKKRRQQRRKCGGSNNSEHDNRVYSENSVSSNINLTTSLTSTTAAGSGILMLRRRALDSSQLEAELSNLIIPYTSYLNLDRRITLTQNCIVELDISRNLLTEIPSQVAHFTHLRILNASSNRLHEIPQQALYPLQKLEVLILSQNQIRKIPEDMPYRLPNLVTLRIAANSIEKLPDRIDYWTSMRHLQLGSVYGGNKLLQIPDCVTQMPVLEELDVSHNQLRFLPHDFSIPTLKVLNAAYNHLDFIPKTITQCHSLRTLILANNHLMSLPADLVTLTNLELLDISENLLCIMPAEILERMQSSNILITGNPLTRPGHCDIEVPGQEAYSQILKRMMKLGVPRSPSTPLLVTPTVSYKQDQCGPKGTGCLTAAVSEASERYSSRSSTPLSRTFTSSTSLTSLHSSTDLPTFDTFSPSSTAFNTTASRSELIIGSPLSSATDTTEDMRSVPDSPPYSLAPSHLYQDEDASIDHELSYHARKLNIDGSRPARQPSYYRRIDDIVAEEEFDEAEDEQQQPGLDDEVRSDLSDQDIIKLSRSSIVADSSFLTGTSKCYLVDNTSANAITETKKSYQLQENEQVPLETSLFHSLRELATRAILKHDIQVSYIDELPIHLARDITLGKIKCRFCSNCQGPFVNEWVTSVQVKGFGGHPAVVRRVRFCSTKCWSKCLPKEDSKSVVCVHH